ncbi:Sec8 exocyst complex component specific domain family protein [Leishmania donovani]|uniref:Exocyst complex component Sec8 n=1 Tax=Leishmania donovani TaxID=5661 RepID=A0A504XKM6_LEIDO|nr:Sec8 exocyst complex component specific domain family protein [Leishmania donovani]
MCAWRFSAGSNRGATGGGLGAGGAFGGAAPGSSTPFSTGLGGIQVSSTAGALLRQNAVPRAGGSDFGRIGDSANTASARFPLSADAAAEALAVVGQHEGVVHPLSDEDDADEDDVYEESEEGYNSDDDGHGGERSLPAKTAEAAASAFVKGTSRSFGPAKMPDSAASAKDQDELDEEDLDQLSAVDRDFVMNTKDLFDDVDAELLGEDFVPHEHVVGIIASEATGGEASPDEIDDNLVDYKDLEAEINADLADYIDAHHQEFNNAICDFSEMVLAVSGSDDTLAQFKKELADAIVSLESHAGELKVLRLRAAKSLFMADALEHIQEVVLAEAEVKGLLQNRHYLAAVQTLQAQARLLASDELKGVRAVQTLRDTHNATISTLHHLIIDDLLACVFRHERLVEADAQLLQEMLDSSERDTKDTNAAAPSVQHTIYKYWKMAGVGTPGSGHPDDDEDDAGEVDRDGGLGAATHNGTAAASTKTAGVGGPARKDRTLSAIIETLIDDPTDDQVFSNYLKFVPLCVKSLMLLGKIDHCHETFFSRATRSMERFIAHFLCLYDAWRRRTRSGASLSYDEAEAAIRGTHVRALDLACDLISFDEAVATIQARDLRSMLGALFTELEKILRNAAYLQKVVLVAHFPFVSPFVVQPAPFVPEATSRQWNVMDVPLRNKMWLHDTLTTALDYAQKCVRDAPAQSDKSSPRSFPAGGGDSNAGDAMAKFLEFFNADAVLASLKAEAEEKDVAAAAAAAAATTPVNLKTSGGVTPNTDTAASDASPFLAFGRSKPCLTLQSILNLVDSACAQTRAIFPAAEAVLRKLQLAISAELRDAVRMKLVAEVQALLQEWDLQVLWSQLNYHIEFVFHVICDAKESQDETDDAVTLLPFLRQKNLISRVQRTATIMLDSDKQGDDTTTLDRLLSTYASGGLLRMVEETGTVSFSLVGAVKKAQADMRKARERQASQFDVMQCDKAKLIAFTDSGLGGGGVGGAGAPLVLLHASMLRRWFVFTAMNALTCYECAARFYSRSCDRVPEFRLLSEEECVVGFFKRFLRATYIPTLHAFHSQQLQLLLMSIGDSGGTSAAGATPSASPPPADAGSTTSRSGKAPAAMKTLSGAWPTVVVDEVQHPILACVQYVGQVLAKVSDVRRILPDSLTGEVEQNTSEALIMELVVFLKRQVEWLGRGTLAHRLLDKPFQDAFSGMPNRRWAALVDEENILDAHRYIDQDLYRYYQLNSDERTSGHEYNRSTVSVLEAMRVLETSSAASPGDGGDAGAAEAELDQHIGRMEPRDICVRDDSTLVAFALLCTSAEWLCDVLLRYLWPSRRKARNYTDCCVPGYCFAHEMRVSDATSFVLVDGDYTAQQKVRLSGHLVRLCSLAQVALFHLSVEARFLAFLFLPQLRDVSYDVVAVSSAADMFVQAYARRVHNFYAILRQHLHAKKIKYTCLTAGKPASELILMELAHLRDKAISQAGLVRLRTDLLVMQTTLQLVLPTDSDVRLAVSRFFLRPVLFLRYIFNKDVVNEIVSSLDYLNFSTKEVEVLIRLVFRQVSGANDDTLAVQQIQFFYQKLKSIRNLCYAGNKTGGGSSVVSEPLLLPDGGGSSVGAIGGGGLPPFVPLSTNAAAVAAAALDGGDDYHSGAFSYDDGGSDASDSQPPPLPLSSATRSRQSAAGCLAASPSILAPPKSVPVSTSASAAAAPRPQRPIPRDTPCLHSSSAAAAKPALARPVVPPLATTPFKGAPSKAPAPAAKTGAVKVEARPPHPGLHPAGSPTNGAAAAIRRPSASSAFAPK